jgi:hypothetical protein
MMFIRFTKKSIYDSAQFVFVDCRCNVGLKQQHMIIEFS